MQGIPSEAARDEDGHPESWAIELGEVLSALADPLRRRVVATLARLPDGTERTCASFNLGVSKASLTHHFRTLRHAGLVRQIDRGNSRAAVLRRSDIEERFPGLLSIVAAESGE
jgi:DNA-binding transcriptional ArsR family regulator